MGSIVKLMNGGDLGVVLLPLFPLPPRLLLPPPLLPQAQPDALGRVFLWTGTTTTTTTTTTTRQDAA